jgi:hypothetical protein
MILTVLISSGIFILSLEVLTRDDYELIFIIVNGHFSFKRSIGVKK